MSDKKRKRWESFFKSFDKKRCLNCGKKWKSGFYCPECHAKFETRGGCRHV